MEQKEPTKEQAQASHEDHGGQNQAAPDLPAVVQGEAPQNANTAKPQEKAKEPTEGGNPPQVKPWRFRAWVWAKRDAKVTDWLIVILTAVIAGTSYLQWREIRSGSSDTHTLAVAAGKQADAASKQADASKALAELTAKQFTASQRLIESQRASIEVSFASVNNPVTFHDGSLSIVFSVALRNVGRLTANKVKVRFTPYFSQWGEAIFSEPMRRQRDFCNKPNTFRLRKDLRDLRELMSHGALTIIAGETKGWQINFGMGKPTDSDIIEWPPNEPNQTKRIFPIIVGCVDYQSGVMPKNHQTGFIFEIQRGDPRMPTLITLGEDVPREDVVVTQYFFGQGKSY